MILFAFLADQFIIGKNVLLNQSPISIQLI